MTESVKSNAEMAAKGDRDSCTSRLLSDSGVCFARMISARVIVIELLICSARP
jgi:hypothetical protein